MRGGSNKKDLTNQEFDRLTVLRENGRYNRRIIWECQCKCGNIVNVKGENLRQGITTSCGCFHSEVISARMWKGHGEISQTFWSAIVKSADRREIAFEINVEYAWQLFLEQDRKCKLSGVQLCLQRSYGNSLHTASLDRIDNTKGYITGNVQWLHKDVNKMKNIFSQGDFIEWCQKIAKNTQP